MLFHNFKIYEWVLPSGNRPICPLNVLVLEEIVYLPAPSLKLSTRPGYVLVNKPSLKPKIKNSRDRKKDWLVGCLASSNLKTDSGKVSCYSIIVHHPLATGLVNSTRLCWMGSPLTFSPWRSISWDMIESPTTPGCIRRISRPCD